VIHSLREEVEAKAKAEQQRVNVPVPDARIALINAAHELHAKTRAPHEPQAQPPCEEEAAPDFGV
jgi:hypothetical protein